MINMIMIDNKLIKYQSLARKSFRLMFVNFMFDASVGDKRCNLKVRVASRVSD